MSLRLAVLVTLRPLGKLSCGQHNQHSLEEGENLSAVCSTAIQAGGRSPRSGTAGAVGRNHPHQSAGTAEPHVGVQAHCEHTVLLSCPNPHQQ